MVAGLAAREEQEKHVRRLPAPLRGLDYLVGQVLADDSQAEKVLEAASHPPLLLVLAVDWHPPVNQKPSHYQCAMHRLGQGYRKSRLGLAAGPARIRRSCL